MDQLAPSNVRPISVNEYPLPLKPIANDIQGDAARRPSRPGLEIIACSSDAGVSIEISHRRRHCAEHRIEITLTNRENEFPAEAPRRRKTLFSLRGDGGARLSVCPLSEFQLAACGGAAILYGVYARVRNVQARG